MTKLSILFLFFAAALPVGAQTASVSGVVKDASGAIVSDAKIALHRVSASLLTFTGETDAAGRFSIKDLSAGRYLIEASAPGLSLPQSQVIDLAENEHKDLPLQLSVSALTTLITVTSADTPQSVDQVSKALDVISVEDAQRRGMFSVADALRSVPGLRITTRGSPGDFTTIQTRGLRTTDTAVLLDGFPFRDPTSIQDEASAYLGDLLLVASSRIEVLRGSGSSLYGSNAMSGTVNIITDEGGGPLHGDFDVQGGGLGLFRGLAQIAGGGWNNRLHYSIGAAHLNVANGVADATAVRNWSGQGSVSLALRPNMRLGMTALANTGYLQLTSNPSPSTTAPTSGIIPANANTLIPSLEDPDYGRYSHFASSLIRFEHELTSRFSYRIGYGLVASSRNNTNGPAGPENQNTFQPFYNTSDGYTGRIDTLQARATYAPDNHETFTGGYEFQREHYDQVNQNQNPNPARRLYSGATATQKTNALFAQDEVRLLSGRLRLLASGRYTRVTLDQPSFAGSASPFAVVPLPAPPHAWTGDAAVSYFVPRTSTKLRAHFGNSFRTPSIYERFGAYFYGGTYYAIGDPRLAPERSVSGDFGIDQYMFHDRIRFSGSYFYAHLQQVIGYLSFPPSYVDVYGRSGGYYNTTGGISRGAEVSAEIHPGRKTAINASYVYTKGQDRFSQYYTGSLVDPLQTPRIMPHVFNVSATQQLTKRIDLAMDLSVTSSYLFPIYGYDASFNSYAFAYRFGGQHLLGLGGGYTLPLRDRMTLRFYGRLSNALGQTYYEDGFQTPGRWAVAGLRFGF